MTLEDWIAALTGNAALTLAVLWLARNVIIARLTRSVQHEFDEKLQRLSSSLREKEEALRSELHAKQEEMNSLRRVALSALETRSAELTKRRLTAVDDLWHATTQLKRTAMVATMMQTLDMDEVFRRAPREDGIRKMFGMILGDLDIKALDLSGASRARPYVDVMAWAMYSAFQAILLGAVMNAKMVKDGIDVAGLIKKGELAKLAKTALPARSAFLDEHGDYGAYFLLDDLEQGIISSLQDMLAGRDADGANVAQAAEILKQANVVAAATVDAAKQAEK